jgi:hypothetical protein
VTACRACGGKLGETFCDLGIMAVANSYVPPERAEAPEPAFPLRCVTCRDCRLVQLDTVVNAEGIFSDYAYFSSASVSWLDHAKRYAEAMIARFGLGPDSFVAEVASNDGYLLRNFVAAGIPCLGIEPAANVADLIAANNVLAHVPDVNDFVAGLAVLAGPEGVVTVEAPHLVRLVDGVQFDTIYHEHYAYWSLLSMERLLARHGLRVFDVERLPTHGGSLRVFSSAAPREATQGYREVRAEEAERGLDGDAFYRGFDARVQATLAGFRTWLAGAKAEGRRIGAYGAAAKGNTLLNAAGVKAADILAVADRSPAKQGRLLPGSHIPVVTPEALLVMPLDDILILPWNIAPEIARFLREGGFRGRLLIAVPEMQEVAA